MKDSDEITTTTKATTTKDPRHDCDYVWNGCCYFLTGSTGSWYTMRNWCINNGADLISIHSYNENDIIAKISRGNENIWIDLCYHGKIKWSDGTKYDYEKADLRCWMTSCTGCIFALSLIGIGVLIHYVC